MSPTPSAVCRTLVQPPTGDPQDLGGYATINECVNRCFTVPNLYEIVVLPIGNTGQSGAYCYTT